MGVQTAKLQVSAATLPAGYCPQSYDQLLTDFANRLIVTPNLQYATFVYGPVAPTSDQGPWFNTLANEWWVWDNALGAYRSEKPSSITGEVSIGTIIHWDGTVAAVNAYWGDKWLFANGQAISRTAYSTYFALIGTKWGVGDGSTTFNIIDARDCAIVGASVDSAGNAQTTISDGSTLTTQRAYTKHVHDRNTGLAAPNQGIGSLGAGALTKYTDVETNIDASGTATRVLPPYKAAVPIVRVK